MRVTDNLTARVVSARHAGVQNPRRGHLELKFNAGPALPGRRSIHLMCWSLVRETGRAWRSPVVRPEFRADLAESAQ